MEVYFGTRGLFNITYTNKVVGNIHVTKDNRKYAYKDNENNDYYELGGITESDKFICNCGNKMHDSIDNNCIHICLRCGRLKIIDPQTMLLLTLPDLHDGTYYQYPSKYDIDKFEFDEFGFLKKPVPVKKQECEVNDNNINNMSYIDWMGWEEEPREVKFDPNQPGF